MPTETCGPRSSPRAVADPDACAASCVRHGCWGLPGLLSSPANQMSRLPHGRRPQCFPQLCSCQRDAAGRQPQPSVCVLTDADPAGRPASGPGSPPAGVLEAPLLELYQKRLRSSARMPRARWKRCRETRLLVPPAPHVGDAPFAPVPLFKLIYLQCLHPAWSSKPRGQEPQLGTAWFSAPRTRCLTVPGRQTEGVCPQHKPFLPWSHSWGRGAEVASGAHGWFSSCGLGPSVASDVCPFVQQRGHTGWSLLLRHSVTPCEEKVREAWDGRSGQQVHRTEPTGVPSAEVEPRPGPEGDPREGRSPSRARAGALEEPCVDVQGDLQTSTGVGRLREDPGTRDRWAAVRP